MLVQWMEKIPGMNHDRLYVTIITNAELYKIRAVYNTWACYPAKAGSSREPENLKNKLTKKTQQKTAKAWHTFRMFNSSVG